MVANSPAFSKLAVSPAPTFLRYLIDLRRVEEAFGVGEVHAPTHEHFEQVGVDVAVLAEFLHDVEEKMGSDTINDEIQGNHDYTSI